MAIVVDAAARETTEDLLHRFTRRQYYEIAELGFFDNKRVELLDGLILDMPPQDEAHVAAVSNLIEFLAEHLKSYRVRCQGPVSPDEFSEPEPDFAVTARPTKARKDHPATAILVIEVSNTTLARDRAKGAIYAAAGVKEYWIVNLRARAIEQYTKPQSTPEAHYAARQILQEAESVQCTVLPLPPLSVKECLRWV
jgi:Uma2 family endonuclease